MKLGLVKKRLGRTCTYLSHYYKVTEGTYFIKAIIKNGAGGKDVVMVKLNKHPSVLDDSDYEELFKLLSTGDYESVE